MMTFGQCIRELRKSKGWSIYDLANRLGVQSLGYISEIEARGEIPSPDMVIKLAEVLGTDPGKLIKLAKQEKARELTENVQKKYDNAFALHRKAKVKCEE